MSEFMDIITSDNLSYKQKVLHLAQAAENSEHPIKTTAEFDRLLQLTHLTTCVRATLLTVLATSALTTRCLLRTVPSFAL